MKELELKHIAPYLPYGLKAQLIIKDKVVETGEIRSVTHHDFATHPTKISINYGDAEHIWMFKPILRPLSDLSDEYIDSLTNDLDDRGRFRDCVNMKLFKPEFLGYYLVQLLLENHFDIFGLIDSGLAIDKNTIK